MQPPNQTLLNLLEGQANICDLNRIESYSLSSTQMSTLYINAALIEAMLEFLGERHWLERESKGLMSSNQGFAQVTKNLCREELSPIKFLEDLIIKRGERGLKETSKRSNKISLQVISSVMLEDRLFQKDFMVATLKQMSVHFQDEESRQLPSMQHLGHQGPRLYRTFDSLDLMFALNYSVEKKYDMSAKTTERIYKGSGAGVQSGYSTILLAINALKLPQGASIIDLGSGFGRVGLVYSLLRPDIKFTGFEYVAHRVSISNAASKGFDLHPNLAFITKDLSKSSFSFPTADVYYLYDPFTKETYQSILNQLVKISEEKRLIIVTKGNARDWLIDLAAQHSWPAPQYIDHKNLCIFQTSLPNKDVDQP